MNFRQISVDISRGVDLAAREIPRADQLIEPLDRLRRLERYLLRLACGIGVTARSCAALADRPQRFAVARIRGQNRIHESLRLAQALLRFGILALIVPVGNALNAG